MKLGNVIDAVESAHKRKLDLPRLRELLDDLSLSYADIAANLGVTRERVRQMDLKLNGRTAQERKPLKPEFESPFCLAAKARGLTASQVNRTSVSVEGLICISAKPIFGQGPQKQYTKIRASKYYCNFMVYPIGADWLIVPRQILARETMFSLNPKPRMGTYSSTHGWPKYLNAWNQLKEATCESENQLKVSPGSEQSICQ